MTIWDALFLPLIFLSGGLGIALVTYGFPSLITINKHYHGDEESDIELSG